MTTPRPGKAVRGSATGRPLMSDLDPRLRRLIAQDEPAARLSGLTAADVRAADGAILSLQRPAPALHSASDLTIPVSGGLGGRLYRPAPGPLPVLLYFHGGGFVIGGEGYERPLRELALATGCLIIAPHVRLAPEHSFPAAHEDALACARWAHASARELAGGASTLGIAGDSSGGNLAAATTRDLTRQRTSPAFQVLIYPMLDATASSASYRELGTGYGFTREKSLWYFGQYLPEGSDRRDRRISPLHEDDLTGLPPTLVVTAEYDPLRDEGEQYARAIGKAGGTADMHRYDGMIHGFFQMTGHVNAAREVQADIAAWISEKTAGR
ncbi:MAG: alpha/beta hydrolase [Trebonia sp.]